MNDLDTARHAYERFHEVEEKVNQMMRDLEVERTNLRDALAKKRDIKAREHADLSLSMEDTTMDAATRADGNAILARLLGEYRELVDMVNQLS